MSNLLIAIKNLINDPQTSIVSNRKGNNRANSMGDALEQYIMDLFCGSFYFNESDAMNVYESTFSYKGNKNNPPDMILTNSDAIEVKKIESINSSLALNSSYPKKTLLSTSTLITEACRIVDKGNWVEKDIIYSIGVCPNNILKGLWFVYGDCYAADHEVYEGMRKKLKHSFSQNNELEFSETNELARVNKVDPLGITYLRVRGMWGIENPKSVFNYLNLSVDSNLFCHAIMKTEKYNSFPTADKEALESLVSDKFKIMDVKIKSPNNPVILMDAKLLSLNI